MPIKLSDLITKLNVADINLVRACQELEYFLRTNVHVEGCRSLFEHEDMDEHYYVLLLMLARATTENLFRRVVVVPASKAASLFTEIMLLCAIVETVRQRYPHSQIPPSALLLTLVANDRGVMTRAEKLLTAFFGSTDVSTIIADREFVDKLQSLYTVYNLPISNLVALILDYLLQCIWNRMNDTSALTRIRMRMEDPIPSQTAPLWMTCLTMLDDSWLTK